MSEVTTEEAKIATLAAHLGEDKESISVSSYDDCLFEVGSREYAVMTDDEATQRANDYIKDSLWAFNSSFLASFCDLPEEMFKAVQEKCEDGNDAVLQCVERADGGLEKFCEEAIGADGRGHFLNTYDGNEEEVTIPAEVKDGAEGESYYVICRTN